MFLYLLFIYTFCSSSRQTNYPFRACTSRPQGATSQVIVHSCFYDDDSPFSKAPLVFLIEIVLPAETLAQNVSFMHAVLFLLVFMKT
jgi:hypothetical protein